MLDEAIRNSSHENRMETKGEQTEHRGWEHSAEGARDLANQTRYPTSFTEKSPETLNLATSKCSVTSPRAKRGAKIALKKKKKDNTMLPCN